MPSWKIINTTMFLFLSFFLFLFYGMIFFEIWSIFSRTVFFIGLALLFLGLIVEKQKLKQERYILAHKIEVIVATTIAAFATFLLAQLDFGHGSLGPVVAASVVGLSYTLVAPRFGDTKLATPIYCGAFVGMSSPLVLPQLWTVGVAGLLAGLVYIASHEIYIDTGGTLGTIAFTGTLITRRVILKVISWFFGD